MFQASVTESTVSGLEISACLTGRQQRRLECGSTSSTTTTSTQTSTEPPPITTTQAPSTTSAQETITTPTTTTTQAPSTTSARETTTTQTTTTTQAPSTTSARETTTTQTTTTTQAPSTTSARETTTTQTTTTTQAPSTTSARETTTTQTTTTISIPSSTTSASDTGTTTSTAAVPVVSGSSTTTALPNNPHSTSDYDDALTKSILFYEAQRSGKLPANNRIPWREDSALNDQGQMGEDLTGGWYDAGDHVKFNFPQAASVTVLAWGILSFWDGYVQAGELDNVLDSIKWPLEYLLKCHVAPNKFYAQVGNGHVDHAYWGRPEDMTMDRPAYFISAPNKNGSDLAGEVAAAMAASSLVFRKYGDTDYADILLGNATVLFDFADRYRGIYSEAVPEANDFYRSWSGYEDELAWSALWLYNATGDEYYFTKAANFNPWTANNLFSWDDKSAGVALMFYLLDTPKKSEAKAAFERFLDNWADGKNGIIITPKGLSWGLQWGSLRFASNAAFLALVAAKEGIQVQKGINFARKQINYVLGDVGHSFLCGFGDNPPQRPHHRGSSCRKDEQCQQNDPRPNPNVLDGALVGGPDQNDVWADVRTDYIRNEVAIDYNAGFQSSVAGLIDLTT